MKHLRSYVSARATSRPRASFTSAMLEVAALSLASFVAGCGSTGGTETDASTVDGGSDAGSCVAVSKGAIEGSVEVPGSCAIHVEGPPVLNQLHIPVGSPLDCHSSPPSSGPHYPVWASYKTHTIPIAPGYYVHNLEHGAIVFLYKCTEADGCPAVVSGLEAVAAGLAKDPKCIDPIRARTVIAPDPTLTTPVVALAWGFIYRADCVDAPSLNSFATEHYGKGPEDLCANGQDF